MGWGYYHYYDGWQIDEKALLVMEMALELKAKQGM
jgi:hypothetical protein